ncbi:MAG: hypothetical protein B7Y39_08990 [Bdellovibrio sp. 28-41-41]|nr:MAG: hypothetical protein B7Y39_08990 [Bdellovibrio sp. 28-41-41]
MLSLLPRKVRFAVMRNQLKVSQNLDSQFTFKIARTRGELSDAYRILHDSYVELGYTVPQISGMRIVKYFAVPSTTTLIALFDGKVVGTISIIRRGSFGLPADAIFDLSEFIDRNEVIAEVSSLAIDSKFRQKRGALFLPLLKYFWEYTERFMILDSIVISVSPTMSDFYEGFLGFKRLPQAEVAPYSFVNGVPAVGLYLNIKTARKVFSELYDHKKTEKNLYRYFVDLKLPHFEFPNREFYKSSDPVMSAEMLDYFFNTVSNVFSELNLNEKLGLSAAYPELQYRHVLPAIDLERQRRNIRHSVNLKCFIYFQNNIEAKALDISESGVCVISSVRLSGIILIQIRIADEHTAEIRGHVQWENVKYNTYGIRILKADAHWKDFVSYLLNDFIVLTNESVKKVS